MTDSLTELESNIQYHFRNNALLLEAVTHPSFCPENKDAGPDNQRLEFLGDSVFHIIITRRLFDQFPTLPEGELTKIRAALAKELTLSKLANEIDLGRFLRLGHGEKIGKGHQRTSTLCDAFEALLGAIYLDCDNDMAEAGKLVDRLINTVFADIDLHSLVMTENPKGLLQEWTQKRYNETPIYQLHQAIGPDHKREFTVGVYIRQECWGNGKANKLQKAEEHAARMALKRISQTGETEVK
jgi:ribonuclease-3